LVSYRISTPGASRAAVFALLLVSVGCEKAPWPESPPTPSPLTLSVTLTIGTPDDASAAGTETTARTVEAVVRATPSERSVGLMYRKKRLADDEGMLFAMDEDTDHSFWMKNTFIPLDMLFIDRDGVIVGILPDVQPLTRQSRRVGKPSRFVLELDAGFCDRHKVTVGQRVEMNFHSS